MNANRADAKADPWDALKELQEKTEAELRSRIDHVEPTIRNSVGASIEAATKAFDSAIQRISTHGEKEQLELLEGYRKFLLDQVEFVDFRLRELHERNHDDRTAPTQVEIGRAAQRAFWFPPDLHV